MKNFKLCYVRDNKAYFTTQDLTRQTGDDWNDAPYEHNAGEPYDPSVLYYADGRIEKMERDWNADGTPKWEIKVVVFECDALRTPAEQAGSNSPYSVDMINAGYVARLAGYDAETTMEPVAIQAGVSIEEFKKKVRQCGGKIYVEEEAKDASSTIHQNDTDAIATSSSPTAMSGERRSAVENRDSAGIQLPSAVAVAWLRGVLMDMKAPRFDARYDICMAEWVRYLEEIE